MYCLGMFLLIIVLMYIERGWEARRAELYPRRCGTHNAVKCFMCGEDE